MIDRAIQPSEAKLTLVEEISHAISPFATLQKLSHLPYAVFLDSSARHHQLGQASYVAADPFKVLKSQVGQIEDLHEVDRELEKFVTPTVENLPSFQGGAVNFCSYDLKRCFERIPLATDEFEIPDLFVGFYDVVIAFDHVRNRTWLISQGFPEVEPAKRRVRAEKRLAEFKDLLTSERVIERKLTPTKSIAASQLVPQKTSAISSKLTSNFSKSEFVAAVQRGIDYIYEGDIFQVNLSQRLLAKQEFDSLTLYQKLREQNAATFSVFLDLGEFQILSSSPERLLSVDRHNHLETRPIKGTRQRSCYPEANLFLAEGLITSEKDRAENVMIVDLLRNDLSKICEDDSIHVSQLCGLEEYEFVQHLVSVIRGQINCDHRFTKIFSAIFPGGSITGAPKVRAMEIIAEIEGVARGAYCGSIGYFSFDGAIDQNILIRTISAGRGWCQIPVGGGIVSQSDPLSEYEETVHKAHGMVRAIF